MTPLDERVDRIFEVTGEAIVKLRLLRSRAQAHKSLDISDVEELKAAVEQIRHHCEMFNNERAR